MGTEETITNWFVAHRTICAVILITAALFEYLTATVLVKKGKYGIALKIYTISLLFSDLIGTSIMYSTVGHWDFRNIHSITGVAGVTVMLILVVVAWVGRIVKFQSRKYIFEFKAIRIIAYCFYGVWLISYLTGIVSHMPK